MSEPLDFKKISVHKGPQQSPGFLLWHISTSWRGSIEAVLKILGLTHPQFVVLAATGWLTRDGASITQVAIAKMTGLDPNTTSQVIKGLEGKKLIQRSPSSDGRAKNVALTAQGSDVLSQALPAVEQADATFFSALTQNETGALMGLFQKLFPEPLEVDRKSEGKTKGLIRSTVRATPKLVPEREWQSSGLSFEMLPQRRASKKEIDLDKFTQFLEMSKRGAEAVPNKALLKAYEAIVEEHAKVYPTTAGILLFGKDPQKFFSEARIICSHFRGNAGREAIATINCIGDLLQQFHQAETFVFSRLSSSYTIQSSRRTERLEIPAVALQEALLNAVVHRDYHLLSPIEVAIYENRIEIFSPGQFPGPMDLKNLRAGITYLRNPVICKVFREVGYMNKIGSGLITIFDSYEEWNLAKPRMIEEENGIKCILPRGET